MYVTHFKMYASYIKGGDSDAASKGIVGICEASGVTYLLILVIDWPICIYHNVKACACG